MTELSEFFRAELERIQAPTPDLAAITDRGAKIRIRQRIASTSAALAVVGVSTATVFIFGPTRGPADDSVGVTNPAIVSPTVVAEVVVPGVAAGPITADASGAWIVNSEEPNARLWRVDDGNATDVTSVESGAVDIELLDQTAWVASFGSGRLTGINLSTSGETKVIDIGAFVTGIATDGQEIWALIGGGDPRLIRVDPSEAEIVGEPLVMPDSPRAIDAETDFVWVAAADDGGTLVRIDSQTGAVSSFPLSLDGAPSGILVAQGRVWVSDANRVSQVDPVTGKTAVRSESLGPVSGMTLVGEEMWVAIGEVSTEEGVKPGAVIRLDSGTLQPVGNPLPLDHTPHDIVALGTSVWISSMSDGVVMHIEI